MTERSYLPKLSLMTMLIKTINLGGFEFENIMGRKIIQNSVLYNYN